MSVLRSFNWLGEMRVDVPFLRSIDSSICGDMDALVGRSLMANDPVVIRGFTINTSGVTGTPATSLELNTADGIAANLLATESGSYLWVPTAQPVDVLNSITNSNVIGSFTPLSTNNIGIDFVRSADSSTSDLAEFLDPNTLKEVGKVVPLGRTLKYRIIITTLPFASQPNLIPIAIVTTTAQNNISTIVDARNMFGRLASGGDFPNINNSWPFATPRTEGSSSNFGGPDKNFQGLRDWMSAAMTRIWEIGGGEAWFSNAADRNVYMIGFGTPLGSGDFFAWSGTDLTWQGLRFTFDNSTGWYNILNDQATASPGLTDLADGDCLYVDLQRQTQGATLTAHKTTLLSAGQGNPPGSRQIFAVRAGANVFTKFSRAPVGAIVPVATTTSDGIVRLFQTPASALHPVVLNLNSNNAISWTASGGNATALTLIGNGTGAGLNATGGSNANGIVATGVGSGMSGVVGNGGTNGNGLFGNGNGTGPGVSGVGGSSGGSGGSFTAGAAGHGVTGLGGTTGNGVVGIGGPTDGSGGSFSAGGDGSAVTLIPGSTQKLAVSTSGVIKFTAQPGATAAAHVLSFLNTPIAWYTADMSIGVASNSTSYNIIATSGTLNTSGMTFSLSVPLPDNHFCTIVGNALSDNLGVTAQTATGGSGGGASVTIAAATAAYTGKFSFMIFSIN